MRFVSFNEVLLGLWGVSLNSRVMGIMDKRSRRAEMWEGKDWEAKFHVW